MQPAPDKSVIAPTPEGLAEAIRQEARLGDDLVVETGAGCVVVQRRAGRALVVRAEDLDAAREQVLRELGDGEAGLVLVGGGLEPAQLDRLVKQGTVTLVPDPAEHDQLLLGVHGALERIELKVNAASKERDLSRARYELGELVEIARAITQERDLSKLLDLILVKSRYITGADAGSIYVLEGNPDDAQSQALRFKLSQNDSVAFESSEFSMPVSTRSIAGAVVVGRELIHIEDVYAMPEDAPYSFDASFDQKVGYRTCSVVAVPMVSATGEVIGVIQLINRKRDPKQRLSDPERTPELVLPFDQRSQDLLVSLASQAGIALENALLYDEIRGIFEGFVRASVQAIEQRDPTTSGHSQRVSLLACTLAEKVDRADSGVFKDANFTPRALKELEYASLLHDFGKIGVREEVLVKAKKLYPHQLSAIEQRIRYAQASRELTLLHEQLNGPEQARLSPEGLARELAESRDALEDALGLVREANEPSVLQSEEITRLSALGEVHFRAPDGTLRPLLTPQELDALRVRKGSLSDPELEEIRSHVVHTQNFLQRIPWGRTFSGIPEIAGAHHERLDGTGYPRRLTAEQIPLQSKIMSVADIYDALTARDRPYKKAIPHERALEILGYEVKEGHVDADLVAVFRDSDVHRVLIAGSTSVVPRRK